MTTGNADLIVNVEASLLAAGYPEERVKTELY